MGSRKKAGSRGRGSGEGQGVRLRGPDGSADLSVPDLECCTWSAVVHQVLGPECRYLECHVFKCCYCECWVPGVLGCCPLEVVKQKKVAVLLQKALTFVPRVTIEPLNLIAKVINHLRIGFLVLVL